MEENKEIKLDPSFIKVLKCLINNPSVSTTEEVFNKLEEIIMRDNDIDITLLNEYLYNIVLAFMHKKENRNGMDSQLQNQIVNNIIVLPTIKSKTKRRIMG